MKRKLKIAYYCSGRTIFPPPKNIIAANAEVMYEIVKGMLAKGHDITVYAAKGSKMKGVKIIDLGLPAHKLDPAYRSEEWVKDLHISYRVTFISELIKDSAKYDLIHLHVGRVIFGEPFVKFAKCPVIFTIHENLEPPFGPLMNFYKESSLVSVSDSQRKVFPYLNYIATVYHGVNVASYSFNPNPTNSFLFLSRISKEKGVELAIKAAQKTKVSLDIYGPGEKNYLKKSVLLYLNKKISYRGMVKKYSPEWYKAYAQAKALLFPIQWEEPFGLVMTESMSCGTPIIAFARGSVPEIIKDGKTGFIVNPSPNDIRGDWIVKKTGIRGLCEAIERIYSMPEDKYQKMRQDSRARVEEKFTAETMVANYEKVYQKTIKN